MTYPSSPPPGPDPYEALAASFPADPSAAGFSTSARGIQILATIHADLTTPPPRRWRPTHRRIGVGVALLALAGTAAAVATAVVITPANPTAGVCLKTLDLQADLAQPIGGITELNNPAPTCAAQWTQLFPGTPQPTHFINCVYPNGGAVFAAPAPQRSDPAKACADIGAGIPG